MAHCPAFVGRRLRGHSSAGRAPALQAGGRRFDPVWLHQAADRGRRFLRLSAENKFRACLWLRPGGHVLSDIVNEEIDPSIDHDQP